MGTNAIINLIRTPKIRQRPGNMPSNEGGDKNRMHEIRWYTFREDVVVPTAADPERIHTIRTGVWRIVFDDHISRPGNTSECEVRCYSLSFRILRSELTKLCNSGKVQLHP